MLAACIITPACNWERLRFLEDIAPVNRGNKTNLKRRYVWTVCVEDNWPLRHSSCQVLQQSMILFGWVVFWACDELLCLSDWLTVWFLSLAYWVTNLCDVQQHHCLRTKSPGLFIIILRDCFLMWKPRVSNFFWLCLKAYRTCICRTVN